VYPVTIKKPGKDGKETVTRVIDSEAASRLYWERLPFLAEGDLFVAAPGSLDEIVKNHKRGRQKPNGNGSAVAHKPKARLPRVTGRPGASKYRYVTKRVKGWYPKGRPWVAQPRHQHGAARIIGYFATEKHAAQAVAKWIGCRPETLLKPGRKP